MNTLTPVEIDTILSANWLAQGKARAANSRLREQQYQVANGRPSSNNRYSRNGGLRGLRGDARQAWRLRHGTRQLVDLGRKITANSNALQALREEAAPYEAEYRRRPWFRYFLVTSSDDGHVHRETSCGTCRPTTAFGWLVELADCEETEMVKQYGETACTACFPNAPTMEGWGDKAARDLKAAGICEGSGRYVGYEKAGCWVHCEDCGKGLTATATGKLRKHKADVK